MTRLSFRHLAALTLAVAATACDGGSAATSAPQAPELAQPISACSDPEHAEFRGRQAMRQGKNAARRYAFVPSEGPRALASLALADACLTLAGLTTTASIARAEWQTLHKRVLETYRTRRLRLQQALAQERDKDAQSEASRLLSLLETQPEHAYVRWLRRIERNGQ